MIAADLYETVSLTMLNGWCCLQMPVLSMAAVGLLGHLGAIVLPVAGDQASAKL